MREVLRRRIAEAWLEGQREVGGSYAEPYMTSTYAGPHAARIAWSASYASPSPRRSRGLILQRDTPGGLIRNQITHS